ncbi:hypothetical protein CWI36_0160p0020 [Hamiltosporidium magnivora]|uniref:Uncharacterized protein n=1 Tax=Hamiltosporidium magnivora TaxID=148818 RepID=A0A4Q9LJE8_9MICR|nr:hypothetical protein CWI36_0160p0020 [Hamiltosporidium magnivora]
MQQDVKNFLIMTIQTAQGRGTIPNPEDFCESVNEKAVRHTLPIPRLKTENTKYILPFILDGVITIKEPTIKIKEEADIEEENIMAQMVESYNYKR